MKALRRCAGVLCLLQALASCVPLMYVPTEGPESEGVTEKPRVEALVGADEVEVRRQLGDPQWTYRSDGKSYLLYRGWEQYGLLIYLPGAQWGDRSYCWLLEFGQDDKLARIDRETSGDDCREVFWTEEQLLSFEPGDAKTKWQLYSEATEPGPREWRWLCQAADEGHSLARHRLGTIYYYGLDGAERDLVLAYVWYSLAESTGSEVRQLAWLKESLSEKQLLDAQHLLATWESSRCESELFSRIERTQ